MTAGPAGKHAGQSPGSGVRAGEIARIRGAEGDLMELNGWTSPQVLRLYGARARSARARRAYDRIMEDRS
jgi:hypothetical protein